MALTARLEMRQGQSLVMTPQLLQAIKLLQLSHLELQVFVDNELERNPLLERDDASVGPTTDEQIYSDGNDQIISSADEPVDWSSSELETDRGSLEANLDTRLDNVFETEGPQIARLETQGGDSLPLSGGATSSGSVGQNGDEDLPGIEDRLTADISLQDHLGRQLDMVMTDEVDRFIGHYLIDSIDDNGYLAEPLTDIAVRLRVPDARAERVLQIIQGFDPAGVGARDLAECLAIQLRELNRYDPAMQAMLANLPLLAKRDMAALRRVCGVDDEDLIEMIAEIRALDPKPGRAFSGGVSQTVVPDVLIRAAPDGSWLIDLNPDTLPRVLINQTYHARISKAARTEEDKNFIAECLQTASWLTRSLEQRARTILKVASEIVRQQDGFFAYGAEYLRPLNLKTVADAIGMHESTVSRVTSNKYLMSPRGLLEMKYFFSASIPATGYGEAHSAEAVRFKIKALIDNEADDDVLSDDAIVVKLKGSGIDVARRTVAKYRESLKILSSMDRRRAKNPKAQSRTA
jgi:RNA polymerase sigma-54 factor